MYIYMYIYLHTNIEHVYINLPSILTHKSVNTFTNILPRSPDEDPGGVHALVCCQGLDFEEMFGKGVWKGASQRHP